MQEMKTGSIPGWGRVPGQGNGNPLQYSCLENPMGSQRVRHAEQLSTHMHMDVHIHGYITFCQAA